MSAPGYDDGTHILYAEKRQGETFRCNAMFRAVGDTMILGEAKMEP